jgi:YegS/Rv2252/BmrU family lipid kinase
LIFNPVAGQKRRLPLTWGPPVLEEIKELLTQYQIPVDIVLTKRAGHATELAKDCIKQGYSLVIAAGGDGTVSEVAAGLINSSVSLGILPLGSMMNIAWMLSIPFDLEKAVAILKIGRTRQIDIGTVTAIGGKKLDKPMHFIENAGVGLEAQLQERVKEIEGGNMWSLVRLAKVFFEYFGQRTTLKFNRQTLEVRSPLIEISNGPRTAAALTMAPKAKLNDHAFTVSVFYMSNWEIVRYFLASKIKVKMKHPRIDRFKTKNVQIMTKKPQLFHADAKIFGQTPVKLKLLPNALTVIAGFPKVGEAALVRRTWLDP